MKRLQSLSYKTLFTILFLSLAGIVFFLKIGGKTQKVSAAWWDEMWHYRKAISITNSSGSNLTDFQISISIGTSALIASGKMQTDCDDIRITDINGNLLPYWIDPDIGCNTISDTIIYTKIPLLSTSNTTVYLYYGNNLASNTQNGEGVYPQLFDTFNGTNLDSNKYKYGGGGTFTQDNFVSMSNDVGTWDTYLYDDSLYTRDSSTVFYAKFKADSGTYSMIGWHNNGSGSNYTDLVYAIYFDNGSFSIYEDGTHKASVGSYTAGTWYNVKIELKTAGAKYYYKAINTPIWTLLYESDYSSESNLKPGIAHHSVTKSYTDDWRIGKYISTEPTISLQSEESGGAPIAYWKFDEGVGTTAYDSAGNNNGTLTGTTLPSWQSEENCLSGKCLFLNGINASILFPTTSLQTIDTNDFTIEAWVKPTNLSNTWSYLVNKGGSGVTGYGLAISDSNQFSADIQGVSGSNQHVSSSKTLLINNRWQHLVASYSRSGNVNMYIDGKLVESSSITGNNSSVKNNNYLRIGAFTSESNYFTGFIDEFKIYPYARTADQIKQDYNSRGSASSNGSSVNLGSNARNSVALSEGLVGYWKMDEGVGATTADSSGNSNIGTFGTGSSAPGWSSGKFGIGTSYNGSTTNINVADPSSGNLDFDANSFTISTWIYPTDLSTYRSIIEKSDGSSGYRLMTNTSDPTKIGFIRGAAHASAVVSNLSLNLNSWNFVTVVYNSNNKTVTFNINGVTENPIDFSSNTNSASTSTELKFGYKGYSASSNTPWVGSIDEVRIYNRALSPAEVSALYNYAPSPVVYYNFDENSGTIANDKSGNNINGNFGTGNSAPTWVIGKFGGALSFNGSSSYLTANLGNNLFRKGYTFEAWVKPNNSVTNSIFWITDPNQSQMSLNNSSMYIYTNTNHAVSYSFSPNRWDYISYVFDYGSTSVSFYVNGINIGSTYCISNSNIGTILNIGKAGWGWQHYGGSIDDVKIYNYARTQKQIIEDMNAGAPTTSAKSMIAYYKFDEGNGTTAYNSGNGGSSLNGTFGTGSSAPTWLNEGKLGKALSFNGISNYYNINDPGTNSSLDLTDNLTISAWVKKNQDSNYSVLIDKSYSNAWSWYLHGNGSMQIDAMVNGTYVSGWVLTSTNIFKRDIWQHIVWTYDGVTAKIYVNGSKQNITQKSNTGPLGINNSPIKVGIRSDNYGPFNGLIDEVKIYNYALTDEEVKQDYNQGSAIQFGSTTQNIGGTTTSLEYCIPGDTSYCAPPIAEWKMDEGVGTSVNDTSGNNLTSTFTGSPTWTQGKIGKALSFDGSTNGVSLSGPGTYAHETMSAWVYIDSSSPSGDIVGNCHTNYNSEYGFTFYLDGNTLRAKAATNGFNYFYNNITYDVTSLKNRWLHLTMTWDNLGTGTGGCDATAKLYVNGQQVDVGTTNFSGGGGYDCTRPYYYPFSMGGTTQSTLVRPTKVKLDQVRIYNYARTPAQIAYDYNKGGPVGWWKFDECQGNIAYDWSGIGNTGVINIGASGSQTSLGTCQVGTSAAWTNGSTGKLNSSLNFDGADDYVSVNNSTTFNLNQNMSISVWVKLNTLLNNAYPLNNGQYQFYQRGDWAGRKIYFMWKLVENVMSGDSSWGYFAGVSSISNLEDGKWYHLVGVRDGNNLLIYVNGKKEKENSSLSGYTPSSSASNLVFGNPFTGQIDDVRIYNYALTSEQVKTIYNNGAVNFN